MYVIKTMAKINLSLDVLKRLPNGYHEVEMIMQSVSLCDVLRIRKNDKNKIVIVSNNKYVPTGFKNIVYKVYKEMRNRHNEISGVDVYIEKYIPIAAGLAGGSSNAAGMITALNDLFCLNLSDEEKFEIAKKIGADVSFCLKGSTMLATGLGENLKKICNLDKKIYIVICKPNIMVSTKEVYQNLDIDNISRHPDTKKVLTGICDKNIEQIKESAYNVLEEYTKKKYPVIGEIENTMKEHGASFAMMSGSGPTVFGIFNSRKKAIFCEKKLKEKYNQVFVTKPAMEGVKVIGN